MRKKFDYDCSGWATKIDLKCSDGRTIRHGAFKDCDGKVVPVVWQHMHNDPGNVIGHALLEYRPGEGMYSYLKFNGSDWGKQSKLLVEHGDVSALSIWANNLKQVGGDVLHGVIREVSLVLSGANPGAFIDYPTLEHGEDSETEAVIFTGEEIMHSNGTFEWDEESEDFIEHADEKAKEEPKDSGNDDGDETIEDVFNTLSDKQKQAVYAIVGMALENGEAPDEDEEDDEEESEVKHNVFESTPETENDVLIHADDYKTIFSRAKSLGSLAAAVDEFTDGQGVELMHDNRAASSYSTDQNWNSATSGIKRIDYLFPDYKAVNTTPDWISRNMDWVNVVMNGVHHTPFSRIKSVHADITADEARARGYIKGNQKLEEVFTLLKRTTDPQTIYKKQKLDRDDVIDITDFDVVAWIKGEMRIMLDEEIARAILIGDGRLASSDDKIQEIHVRPIATDTANSLYTIPVNVEYAAADTDDEKTKKIIKGIIRGRKEYKGSGNPIFFTTEDFLTDCLLLEDQIGHTLYKTEQELATKLRVSRIVTVEPMEGKKIDGKDLVGVIVNLSDYNVGADKGGAVSLFDDFDIDYNQQKYLIETRISGALTKPKSAMCVTTSQSAG